MTDQLKNILIGLFVTIAITIGVCMVLFLEPHVGDGKQVLHVRFANISGISVGTRVTFAGKPVGEVVSIKEVPDARLKADELGRVFLYDLTLKVDSSVKLYTTDDVALRTSGLMGERSVAILPKAAPENPVLVTNQIVYANSLDPMENTINQIGKVASRAQIAIDHFDKWFELNQHHLVHAVQSFNSSLDQMTTVLATVNKEELVPAFRRSADLLTANLQSIHEALDDDRLLHKTANLIDGMNETVMALNTDGAQTLENLKHISGNLAHGNGTIARFINSDDLYLRTSSIMGKVETLMSDVNHYGVLFQYDKTWQRNRMRRANALKALETPSEFRNYFEGEVSNIQTSLGRLTELLDRASDSTERQKIVQSESFKRDFGSLLRQVQGLTDAIKLYNEELIVKED